MSLPTC